MGDLILADFRSKTYHVTPSLEAMAVEMVDQFNLMVGPDERVDVEMVPYHAGPDCA